MDYSARVKELEDELKSTPYNKATQHHIGLVKAKLAKLREKLQTRAGKGAPGMSYAVRKAGDASVALVGYPSVGKSTVLNALTSAQSEVAAYAFTTLDVVPGLLVYEHAQIQILDLPGLIRGASLGKGRGREVLSVIRSADLAVILIEVHHPEHYPSLLAEVTDAGVRVNQTRPDVKVTKKATGGIRIGSTVPLTGLDEKTIQVILREFRISNAEVLIREDITADQLIDVIEKRAVYMPGITVVTKMDMVSNDTLMRAMKAVGADIAISAEKGTNIPELKKLIYESLGFIRIYCKQAGKRADLEVPLILRKQSSIQDACNRLHRDFPKRFKFARVWGKSAKFPGQRQGLRHVLKDADILELHLR